MFSLVVLNVNLLRDDLISSFLLHTPQKTALSEDIRFDPVPYYYVWGDRSFFVSFCGLANATKAILGKLREGGGTQKLHAWSPDERGQDQAVVMDADKAAVEGDGGENQRRLNMMTGHWINTHGKLN